MPSEARITKMALRPAICTSTPGNALGVLGFELFGDAQQRAEQARLAPVRSFERGVGRMLELRLGFAVVVAHQRRDHIAPPAAQAGNFAVADQVFAVAMMRLAIDKVARRRGAARRFPAPGAVPRPFHEAGAIDRKATARVANTCSACCGL